MNISVKLDPHTVQHLQYLKRKGIAKDHNGKKCRTYDCVVDFLLRGHANYEWDCMDKNDFREFVDKFANGRNKKR